MDRLKEGYGDPSGVLFAEIMREVDIPEFVKEASADADNLNELPSTSFGDPAKRLYPLATAADAWLSREYFRKRAGSMDPGRRGLVKHYIDKAVKFWDLPSPTLRKKAAAPAHTIRTNSVTVTLKSPGHYKEAADKLMELRSSLPYEDRRAFARGLLTTPAELAVKLDPATNDYIEKAAGLGASTVPTMFKAALSRVAQLRGSYPELSNALTKVAHEAVKVGPTPKVMEKVASALDLADKASGANQWYGKGWNTPEESVYVVLRKQAEAVVIDSVRLMNGKTVHASELRAKKDQVDDFFENFIGEIPYDDADQMIQFVKTIPRTDADALVRSLDLTTEME